MSKIRDDLVGVVFVTVGDDSPVALHAGDDVPDGVTVGDHLVNTESDAGPKGNRRRTSPTGA